MNTYSNLQAGAFVAGSTDAEQAIVNNAFERANGVKFETTAIPLERWTVSALVG